MVSNKFFYAVIGSCIVIYLIGIFAIPLMDIDASQYASISREMLERNSFLQIFDQGQNYLDKPPLLFWLSAFSMQILGVYDWAYRLPSIIVLLAGIYATHQFAKMFYGDAIGKLSAMVLATSQAVFLISHDVRTDTMLMGWVMLSIWQLAVWFKQQRWLNFILAFVFIGCGMMTKGPIALMVPGLAFASHFLIQRNWKQFFRWEYIVGILIVGIILLPMCMGLYQQYDLQPGKLINGRPIESGLRFYFWTQSFGRYTGENFYHEMSHFTFLLENMFWSFLPWIFFFLPALFLAVKLLVKQKFSITQQQEFITVGGFLLTYLILARSQAQLPHYIFVVYPLASVITAKFLYDLFYLKKWMKWEKGLYYFHLFIWGLLWIAIIAITSLVFEEVPKIVPVLATVGLGVFIGVAANRTASIPKQLTMAMMTSMGVNILLTSSFYPNLLKYQMGNDAAKVIQSQQLNPEEIKLYGIHNSNALHFYAKHIFPYQPNKQSFSADEKVLTSKDSVAVFKHIFPSAKTIHEGNQFAVSLLTFQFLNPATRDAETPKYVILDLDGKP
ncbi:MAG: glycosyltransferase family 39 protein [Sediminibacterium sp.]|uniref:ArnT family glycosyltransferase n=1 Tax=Sediminibacterium sp. TaxID=1917865 RepID=UPI002727CB63|nr:glycosyltransferase family 39 protein [Sediminibacterium sp.]MDO8996680.1 glycosyltransferase family 39 protein [Sediminibacterium sp.]